MDYIAKTWHELGAGAYPEGTNKLLYEERTYSRVEMNILWGDIG